MRREPTGYSHYLAEVRKRRGERARLPGSSRMLVLLLIRPTAPQTCILKTTHIYPTQLRNRLAHPASCETSKAGSARAALCRSRCRGAEGWWGMCSV